jgi:hypothetical protein
MGFNAVAYGLSTDTASLKVMFLIFKRANYAVFRPTVLHPEIHQIAILVLTVNVTVVLNMSSFYI